MEASGPIAFGSPEEPGTPRSSTTPTSDDPSRGRPAARCARAQAEPLRLAYARRPCAIERVSTILTTGPMPGSLPSKSMV